MRELPILMNGPMVRAVLEGRKTVTRRLVTPAPYMQEVAGTFGGQLLCFPDRKRKGRGLIWPNAKEAILEQCPYGQPGDRLWVRETFAVVGYGGFGQSTKDGYERFETFGLEFAAGGDPVECHFLNGKPVEGTPDRINYEMASRMADSGPEGYRPSIHMPRWASRITLEVTGVRMERLKDISREQAIAEGVDWKACPTMPDPAYIERLAIANRIGMGTPYSELIDYRGGFKRLWESINGAGSWDANPWAWVIEFRRIEQERKAA